MKLSGKVALVIGGSQGIGEAVARQMSAEGAEVAVVASGSQAKADAVAAQLESTGAKARGYVADVRNAQEVEAMVKSVAADFGRIDILVNCAGVFFPTPIGNTAPDDFSRMVDINLKGTWNSIGAVAPIMKEQRYGKIVNIASVCGVMGFGSFAAYCATKAAIIMLTKTLVFELASHGINVNAIGPGNTATPINEYIRTDPAYKDVLAEIVASTPSGKAYSDAEDIAQIAVFLASDAARAMHGSFVLADEGYSAGADFSTKD
ncbi:SDR family NAD(P)-dependent oxidoreductase [Cupriavidus sp. IK-TO18]|uniref:SDR family NAD(P)-dependent oxidoreductase n=1 Tax=Cupriavidus sp. IK-TO18 TaxID=2782182 RepID=UPI0018995CB2|nr:SDR family NAD(P)-dependent oxidoreductase [Cupriavidus sp. IK-TO18]MBF6992515.1 SDR family oxidoreductase [Cupriavidus sp. IK-TO18]